MHISYPTDQPLRCPRADRGRDSNPQPPAHTLNVARRARPTGVSWRCVSRSRTIYVFHATQHHRLRFWLASLTRSPRTSCRCSSPENDCKVHARGRTWSAKRKHIEDRRIYDTAKQRPWQTTTALPRRPKRLLHFGDTFVVALVERPLLDSLGAHESGLCEDSEVFTRRRLTHSQLLSDEDAADAVPDEIAVNLRAEMGPGSLSHERICCRRSFASALTISTEITNAICQVAKPLSRSRRRLLV